MDEEDAEKIAFIMPLGMYCYKMMPFGFRNTGATYMRAMTTFFHDIIHKKIEVYVDDVIIKSKKSNNHMEAWGSFSIDCKGTTWKWIPQSVYLGFLPKKLLWFIVSCRRIELDPSTVNAIQELPPLKNKKDVMSFLGRLIYIIRFITQSTFICETIFKMLKKDSTIKWNDEC